MVAAAAFEVPVVGHAASWGLVTAAQQGDRGAFGQLYERYVDQVFGYLVRGSGNRQLAEDLTSETFLRMLRRIESVSYRGADVGAWLTTIARNLLVDHFRSSRNRRVVLTDDIEGALARSFSAAHGSVRSAEDEVIDRETVGELACCLARLGSDQRRCLRLRFLQGLSSAETAAVMGRSEVAVRGLRHRALRELARLLAPLRVVPGGEL